MILKITCEKNYTIYGELISYRLGIVMENERFVSIRRVCRARMVMVAACCRHSNSLVKNTNNADKILKFSLIVPLTHCSGRFEECRWRGPNARETSSNHLMYRWRCIGPWQHPSTFKGIKNFLFVMDQRIFRVICDHHTSNNLRNRNLV